MKVLQVVFHGLDKPIYIGQLAYYQGLAQFEYSAEFLALGLNLSPFSLNMVPGLQTGVRDPFNGLHGLFNDSLPDGWGLYIMDKTLRQHGIDPQYISPVDRLAFIGSRAMGALSYEPDEGGAYEMEAEPEVDLDVLAKNALELLEGEISEVLDMLAVHGTPSGGARPKVLVGLKGDQLITGAEDLPAGYEHWLAKFPSGAKPTDLSEGVIEYIYSNLARDAGIDFPETKLVEGDYCLYFLTKRFDRRPGNQRVHTHSLAGLINANFRVPDCDYEVAMKVCSRLTKSHEEREKLLRRMIFNIVSGNRDDHTKNFSFLMESDGEWKNSPAYDITYNMGIVGEHSMSVAGYGKNIPISAILKIAKIASISNKKVEEIIEQVCSSLLNWKREATSYDIPKAQIDDIDSYIQRQVSRLTESPKAPN